MEIADIIVVVEICFIQEKDCMTVLMTFAVKFLNSVIIDFIIEFE
jgi:hypothetical protein